MTAPQEVPQEVPQETPLPPEKPLDERTAAALQRLAGELADVRERLASARQQNNEAAANQLAGQEQQLRWQFARLAAGFDVQQFEMPTPRQFDAQKELVELLEPLLQMLKKATAGPRESTALEERIERVRRRTEIAEAARQRVAATRNQLPDGSPASVEAERELREHWQPLLRDLVTERLVLDADRARLEAEKKPFWTSVADSMRAFLHKSGLSVLLAAAAFTAVFFGLRFLAERVVRRRRPRDFGSRLVMLLVRGLALLVAIAATVAVPYARDDWLLLAVLLMFLIGVGWVIVKTAPQLLAEIRLMLNVGAVRENERLLVGGLPYRVESLRFYTKLVNPMLDGGLLRVPIRDLVGQRSRPCADDEPWFPCAKGDVVALQDGTVGVVQLQTPEVVVVVERTDAPRNYPTPAFLQQHPRNLSRGFEVVAEFAVDHRHRDDVVKAMPECFARALRDGLDEADVRSVVVEFARTTASSLDLMAIVGFHGAAAPRFHHLRNKVQALLIAASNDAGYTIALPQLRVHGQSPASQTS